MNGQELTRSSYLACYLRYYDNGIQHGVLLPSKYGSSINTKQAWETLANRRRRTSQEQRPLI